MTSARSAAVVFDDVSFAYPGSDVQTLRQNDWQVQAGSFNLIAGPSGTGKSTLLRCVNGLVPHFSGGRFGGSVRVNGIDTQRVPPRQFGSQVGFISQEPESQMLSGKVVDEIAFGMEQAGLPPALMRKRVEEVLDQSGIAHLRDRHTATLSGGERQRVAIAAALALQPLVLVLDEPTSQLDPGGAEDVLAAVRRLNEDLGITVLMSEHRLERVLAHADTMRVIKQDGIDLVGDPRKVLSVADLEMLPPLAQLSRRLSWQVLPLTVKEARLTGNRFVPVEVGSLLPQRCRGSATLSVNDVSIGYGNRTVLRDITFEARQGEIVALMGRNGSGKTTLLRAIMGLHPMRTGSISIGGTDQCSDSADKRAKLTGFLPQRAQSLLFAESVRDEIAFTARQRQLDPGAVEQIFAEWGLTGLIDRHPHDLSSGEQERVALATVMTGNPPLLLLDEPTRGMDYFRKAQLRQKLTELADAGVAMVLSTHDVELVARLANRVVLLGGGEIVADDTTRSVLAGSSQFSTQINRLYGGNWLTVDDVVTATNGGGQG